MAAEETVVVGAGLAGLTAAAHLAERGVPVLLLEADSLYAGGRLWGGRPHPRPLARAEGTGEGSGGWGVRGEGGEVTITLNGLTRTFYPEHGLHGLWNEYHNLRATLERFGIAPGLILAQEEEWIHGERGRILRAEIGSALRDAFLPAPLHYLELFTRPSFLRIFSWRDWLGLPAVWYGLLLAVALDPFAQLIPLKDQTLQDYSRSWSPRVAALLGGLARNSLATRPTETPLSAFIAFLRFYTLLRRDAWRYTYLTTDPGTALIEPLVKCIRDRGGEMILGATVDGLTPLPSPEQKVQERGEGAGGWGVRFQTPLGPRVFHAGHVVLAVDAPAAQRLLCESLSTRSRAETLNWPSGQPNAVVRVWLKVQPRPGPEGGIFTGDFVVDNFFWLHRIYSDFAEWTGATGGSAVEMHIYGPAEFLALPDAVILARAITDLYRAYPELRGHTLHQTLQRNSATHSKMIVDRPERWLGVRTPWPNLWACGDWVRGPWPALFLERACVSGLEAANAALAAMGLEPFPVMPYSEPEWLAAQIQRWLLGGRGLLRRLRGT
jgi:carotenoid phi-ring synthase / carotenoid chi-ring synthase